MLTDLRLRLRSFFKKSAVEDDLNDELRFHFDQHVEKLIASGIPSAEARRRARLALGTHDKIHEDYRDASGIRFFETLLQDIRFAFRMLRKSPGFTAIAILTLALGIGANTAIFSVVDAILLKSLPYPQSNRLAIVFASLGKEQRAPSSGYEFEQIRNGSRLFDQIGGIWVTNASIVGTTDPQPEGIKVAEVTVDFLSMMCQRPALGRFFMPQDMAPSGSLEIVISQGLWRRKFGADTRIIGKSIDISGNLVTILGVLPPDFRLIFPDDVSAAFAPDVYAFLKGKDFAKPGGPAFLRVIARIRPGATFAQAQSELDEIAGQLRATSQNYSVQNYHLRVFPLQQEDVRSVRSILTILFGGVGLVLLIACVNVANLLLARAGKRERETTVRAALGASRGRLVRQLMTESMVLAFFGGVAAIFVGWAALQGLLALRPESLLRLGAIHLDPLAFAFTLILALVTGIIFGLVPALRATRLDLVSGLKSAGNIRTSAKQGSKTALVFVEVALSFALLAGTGLLVRTFVRILHVDPGFQPANVLSFTTLGGNYSFLHQLQQNLTALPGVQSVSVVSHLPLDGGYANWYDYYWPEGAPADQQNTVMADYRSILPGYFKTIGATMIEGRDFTDSDDAAHQHVIIVDDALAHQAWPGQDPIGKKLHISDSPAGYYQFQDDWAVVVGVVRHVQYHSLTVMVRPQVYEPYRLAPRPVSFVLRASTPLPSLIAPIRAEASKLDKTVALTRFITLSDLVAQARSQISFVTFLSVTLAVLALFLTCIGIYGVTSYLVKSRTAEIGIRMALGAAPSDVRLLVLLRGMAPVALGCIAGIGLSLPLTPLLGALLFGVRPIDPPTFAATAFFLSGIGFLACYIPARRAMRVDPIVALRYE